MSKRCEVQFEELLARTIAEAEAVPCTMAQFLDGLEALEVGIRERREMG